MDIQLPQIIFQIINFSVVMGALAYLLYKPVLKIFEERAERIAQGQKAAEENLAEKQKLEDYAKKVKRDAEKKAAEILQEARDAAKKHISEVAAATKKKAQNDLDKLHADWQDEKAQLLKQAKTDLTKATFEATQKVLGKKLTAASHSKLIDDELKDILASI